ncbi:MAG: HAMP domain-containing sensor histidine kinase [Gaiellaceae bacterium]
MNEFRHPRLSVKLGLVLLAIVAGALGIVYLAVVPRLEDRLVANRLNELVRSAPPVVRDFRQADSVDYDALARFWQSNTGARVVVLQALTSQTLIGVADSNPLNGADVRADPVARAALEARAPRSGRVDRDGERAEVAIPLNANTVVLLSASLRDTLSSVRLVERTLLLSGLVALIVAWLAGSLAALRFTRRIRDLEAAAERIAAGDFEVPVVDPVQDEVGELARAFDSMRLRLAQLDRARREFIANASHELRTPLFSLGGFLELMADDDVDPAVRKEFVDEMSAQVERLTKLATGLLDLTRLDAGQLSVEQADVDVALTATTVCEEFSVRADADAHVLRAFVNGPALAVGDEQRILQVARILVENAIRHTPDGTSVEVGAEVRGGEVALFVSDDGPGVPAADQEHLFDRFYRAGGGQASGSGLGLAIASELAARMGGSIELHSEPGATVFTLLLPRAGRQRAEEAFSRENALS